LFTYKVRREEGSYLWVEREERVGGGKRRRRRKKRIEGGMGYYLGRNLLGKLM